MARKIRVVEDDEYQLSEGEDTLFLWTTRFTFFVGLVGVALGAIGGLEMFKELSIPLRILAALVTSIIFGGFLYWIACLCAMVINILYGMAPVIKIILLVFSIGCAIYFVSAAIY